MADETIPRNRLAQRDGREQEQTKEVEEKGGYHLLKLKVVKHTIK